MNKALLAQIKIYDNGGRTLDRYTVVYPDGYWRFMSANPLHPQGVCMWAEPLPGAKPDGRRVLPDQVPEAVLEAILMDLQEFYLEEVK